jgi:hypothetical protein
MSEPWAETLALTLTRIGAAALSGELTPEQAASRLTAGAEWLKAGGAQKEEEKAKEKPKRKRIQASMDDVREVFEHWRERTGKSRARLNEQKVGFIRPRLRSYSVEQLKRAIDIGLSDAGYQEGGYDGIDNLLRNDERVEKWLLREPEDMAPRAPEDEKTRQLSLLAAEALERGDAGEYDRIQDEIAKRRR